jgi:hypothetical protein
LEQRAIKQLKNETAGQHDFLVHSAAGNLTKIDPDRVTLGELAAPCAIQSGKGKLETMHVVLCDVQAYAPVGSIAPAK